MIIEKGNDKREAARHFDISSSLGGCHHTRQSHSLGSSVTASHPPTRSRTHRRVPGSARVRSNKDVLPGTHGGFVAPVVGSGW